MTAEQWAIKEEIKSIFHKYLVYSDERRFDDFGDIFTENIHMEVYFMGQKVYDVTGLQEMVTAIRPQAEVCLQQYHIAGQIIVSLEGTENASATAYSRALHVVNKDGVVVVEEYNARYENRFVLVNGEWRISESICHALIVENRLQPSAIS